MTSRSGGGAAQDGAQRVEQFAVAGAEAVHEGRRTLDVGHQHRHEARRELRGTVGLRAEGTLRLQLSGDEADGHDLVLLGCVQQSRAGALAGGLVLKRRLAEAGQRVADVGRIVDR
ncbi:MAG: hypothetical protein WKF43_03130 [Acidimicrobiales bacterium]